MSTRKGTKWNNNDRTETINFAENIKKCSQWNCFQKKILIFASLFQQGQRHRGELFGFEPSENLGNSMRLTSFVCNLIRTIN